MFTSSEMIVLLWMVPVVLNIILPLAVLGVWSINRMYSFITGRVRTAESTEKVHPQGRQILSATGN